MLTSKERAELRAQANAMDTTLIGGKGGVTETVIAEADTQLTARELIKGKVLEGAFMTPREVSDAICEATGATNYPSLVSCVDFAPLLNSLVGVPTTFFVDSTGAIVGEPIVGANVPGCMAFVEEYLNGK